VSGRVRRALLASVLGLTLYALVGPAGCAGPARFSDGSAGSRLYSARCRSCHALIDPTTKDLEWWQTNLDKYAQRAHLNATERDSVMAFIERAAAMRSRVN